jgi:hypothetical protein
MGKACVAERRNQRDQAEASDVSGSAKKDCSGSAREVGESKGEQEGLIYLGSPSHFSRKTIL